MRQILQSLCTGQLELLEVPSPASRPGRLLIQTQTSLISAGTERMLLEFGKANLIEKARRHPERVREVLDKIRSQGLFATLEAVQSKLGESIALGYCNVGHVLEVGQGVEGFKVGDRVVSNGAHAELVSVPQHLCALIPPDVPDDEAVFTVVGAIGLQGVRLAEPTLGECFVVMGLGLIGLLTTQLLISHGCRVLGVDYDTQRLRIAEQLGAETAPAGEAAIERARQFSRGRGVDGVLITASTKSDEPMHQAATMCRKRGRIVLVGVAGLNLRRADFYEKELVFRVSCSYGPGRYDPNYEERGADYPVGFVRWTEQRNFEAILDQFASGALSAQLLRTHAFPFQDAQQAYQVITDKQAGALGVLLEYPSPAAELRRPTVKIASPDAVVATTPRPGAPRVAMIGAGNYAKRSLLPHLKRAGAQLISVASRGGLSAALAARQYQAAEATTDWAPLIARQDVDAVAIATRHDSHAHLTCAALQAGKHVFVEKPLALEPAELQRIASARAAAAGRTIMVGFNRRFAPMIQTIKASMDRQSEPKSMIMTVNAGALPADHWCHDRQVGGGRILGEGCHFVDLLRHLAGSPIVRVQATQMSQTALESDKMSITLAFADGSLGAIHYFANGSRAFPKERLEVFCDGQMLQMNDYRRLRSYGWRGVRSRRSWTRDNGQLAAVRCFLAATATGEYPIPWDELVETTEVCFDILTSAESGETIHRGTAAPPTRDSSANTPRSA